MTTEEILAKDKAVLKHVEAAIISLSTDKRLKAQSLMQKFQELRKNLEISIESNETALRLGVY